MPVRSCEAELRKSGKPLGTVPSGMRSVPELFDAGYKVVAGAAVATGRTARRQPTC
jgi:hypothetical protein